MDKTSKLKYVLPGAVILALLGMIYAVFYSTVYFQLRAYTGSKSQVIDEWVREGMDRLSVDRSIHALSFRLASLKALIMENILHAELYMAVIVLTENIAFRGKYRAVDILEYLAIAFLGYSNVLCCMRYLNALFMSLRLDNITSYMRLLVAFGALPVLSTALVLGLFAYFTHRKISYREQVLYGVCVLEMLFTIVFHYNYDPLRHGHPGILLKEHRDVKPQTKDRIFGLAARYGVGPDSIFVARHGYTAYVNSGPLFKIVVFDSRAVLSFTDDQLVGLLSHELGHIANDDCFNMYYFILAITIINFLFVVGIYKTVSGYCNGVTALLVIVYFNEFACFVFELVFNRCLSHGMEFAADYETLKNGHARHQIEVLR